MKRAKLVLLASLFIYICFSFPMNTAEAAPATPTSWHAHVYIINCSDASFSAGVAVAQNLYNTLRSVNGSVVGDSTNNLTVYIHVHWIRSTSQLASTFATLSNDTTSLMASEGVGPIIFLNAHGSSLPIAEPENLFVDSFLYNDPADTYVSVAYSTPKPTWWSYLNSWGQQIRDHGWIFVNVIGYPFSSLSNTPYDYNSNQQQRWGIWTGSGTQQGSGPYPLDKMGLKVFLAPANITVSNSYGASAGTGSRTSTGSSIASKWHQTFPSTLGVSYPLTLLPSGTSPDFSIYSYNGASYVAGIRMGSGMYVHAGFTETGANYTAVGQVAAIAGLEAGWRLSVSSNNKPLGSLTVNVYNNTALTQKVSDRYVITISNATSGQLILNQTTWCPQFSRYLNPGDYTVEITRYFVTFNSQEYSVEVTPRNGTTPTNVTVSAGGASTLNAVVEIPPGVSLSLPQGTYVFVIQCRDAPSWWVGDINKVIEGFSDVMATAGTMFNLIYVNTTQQLYNFMSGNTVTADNGRLLRLGFEYRLKYSIFMNGHGEAVPIPSQFVSGTTPNWQTYFDFIRTKIRQYGWTWVSITGYPFYYVSNHAYDASWSTWNVAGLYTIGSSGVNQFLGTSVDCFWSDYSPISVVGQISYDYWVASKAFHITGIDSLVLGYRPFPETPPSGYSYALTQYEDLVGGQKAAVTIEMGSSPREGYFVHFGVSRHMNDTMKGKLAGLTALWTWFKLGLTWITVVPSNPPTSGISISVWLWNGTSIEPLDNVTLPAGYTNYTFYFVPPYKATLRYTAMVYYNNVYVGSNNIAIQRGRMATLYVDTWNAKSSVSVPEFDVSVFFVFLLIGALVYASIGKRRRLLNHKKGVSTVIMTVLMVAIVVAAALIFYIWYTGWLGKYAAASFRDTNSESTTEEIRLFSPIAVTTNGTQTILAMQYLNLVSEKMFIDSVYVDGNRIFHANSTGQPPNSNFYVLSSNPAPPNLNTVFRLTPLPNTAVSQLYVVLNYYQPLKNIVVRIVASDGQSATFAKYVSSSEEIGSWSESFEAGSLNATNHYWTTGSFATDYSSQWVTPQSVYSQCGQYSGYPASNSMDDNLNTQWQHRTNERHWIVYDMGEQKNITGVRIYGGSYQIRGIDVYVSNNPNNWGSAVVTNWDISSGSGWKESPTFSKMGQYVRLADMDSRYSGGQLRDNFYEFDARVSGFVKSFGVGLTNATCQNGFRSLSQNVTSDLCTAYAYAKYTFGSTDNPYYKNVTMAYDTLSLYLRGVATSGTSTCQVSLKLVDENGGTIGELIYYWGSSDAARYMFTSSNSKKIQVSSSIPIGSWTSFSRNWVQDAQTQFPTEDTFLITAIGLQVGAKNQGSYTRVCWDNISFN